MIANGALIRCENNKFSVVLMQRGSVAPPFQFLSLVSVHPYRGPMPVRLAELRDYVRRISHRRLTAPSVCKASETHVHPRWMFRTLLGSYSLYALFPLGITGVMKDQLHLDHFYTAPSDIHMSLYCGCGLLSNATEVHEEKTIWVCVC